MHFIFEISILGSGIRTDRKEIFFLLYFSACPCPFRPEMKPGWCFLIFKIFLHLFFEISNSGRVRTDRKEIFFPTLFFSPVFTRFVLKWNLDDVFNFWNFFAFIIQFSNSGRVRTDRKEIIFASLFFGLSLPVSSWNEAWMMFFNF